MMHGHGKSDSAIVARKPTNKAGQPAAEPVERRAGAEGNASQQSTCRAQNRGSVSQALERIRHVTLQRMESCVRHHMLGGLALTQGGSRVPELGPLGSVRGALSNEWPYRDLRW
jgi:hypothetical protein